MSASIEDDYRHVGGGYCNRSNGMKLLLHEATSLSRMELGLCVSWSCVCILNPEVEKAIPNLVLIVQGLGCSEPERLGNFTERKIRRDRVSEHRVVRNQHL